MNLNLNKSIKIKICKLTKKNFFIEEIDKNYPKKLVLIPKILIILKKINYVRQVMYNIVLLIGVILKMILEVLIIIMIVNSNMSYRKMEY